MPSVLANDVGTVLADMVPRDVEEWIVLAFVATALVLLFRFACGKRAAAKASNVRDLEALKID